MTDARLVYVATVGVTDKRRAALEAAELEVSRIEAILAESERLESEALSALCAQSLQPTKVTT